MMLDSLRVRLWLSYMISILLSLFVVMVGLFWVLQKSPLLFRQVALRVQLAGEILANQLNPDLIQSPAKLKTVLTDDSEEFQVELLVFLRGQEIISSSEKNTLFLPERLRQILRKNPETGQVLPFRDANGQVWFYSIQKIGINNYLFVFAARPRLGLRQFLTNDLVSPLFIAGILGMILAVFLSLIIGNSLISPLQKMIKAVKELPAGKYETLPLNGPQEVRQLAKAYNEMNSQVQASRESQQDFITNISHELKTPITSIQGFSQAILDDAVQGEGEIKNAARIIFSESGRMHRLVNDLLSLSKLETGMVELQFENVQIVELIQSAAESLNIQSEQKNVAMQINIPEDIRVRGDRHRLLQAFTNLIINAIKFSNINGIVTINAFCEEDYAFIHFVDEGIGISSKDQQRIFERFYQVEKSRSGNPERGLGLGLAITREIIEMHDGTIQLESKPGKGSLFIIKIPRINSDQGTSGEK